ncbi:MAG: winged helix-turn-helix domain-containing protein [Bryobacterales bacterium]|nr:winged helix-turn-helix domain-containing protein [Bryobacterales bacterium]
MRERIHDLGSGFLLSPTRRTLTLHGEAVSLPARAFDVLVLLVENRHRIVTKEELCASVWGGLAVTPNNLNQSITAIRKALGDTRQSSRYIATVPNVGYQFVGEIAMEPAALPETQEHAVAAQSTVVAPRRSMRRFAAFGVIAVACLSFWVTASMRHSKATPDTPYANLNQDESLDWLAPVLAELVRLASGTAAAEGSGSFSVEQGQIRIRYTLRGKPVVSTGPLQDFVAVAVEGSPRGDPMPIYAEARERWKRGDLTSALREMRRAAVLDPHRALVLSDLATLLEEVGHVSEARLLHRRAEELSAAIEEPLRQHIVARAHSEIEGLSRYWRAHPESLLAGLEVARAQFQRRQGAELESTLKTLAMNVAADQDPRVILMRARLQGQYGAMAKVRELAGQAARAADVAGMAMVRDRAHLLEAGAMQNLGLPETAVARERVRSACAKRHDVICLAAVWRVEGNAHMGAHRVKEATASYWTALRFAREGGSEIERAHVSNGLGAALLKEGQHARAEAMFRVAANLNGVAAALLAQGKLAEAETTARESIAQGEAAGDQDTTAHGYLYLAQIRREAALFEKAIGLFRLVGNPEKVREATAAYQRFSLDNKGYSQTFRSIQ